MIRGIIVLPIPPYLLPQGLEHSRRIAAGRYLFRVYVVLLDQSFTGHFLGSV